MPHAQFRLAEVIHGSVIMENMEVSIPVPWGVISGKWWGSRNIQPILAFHGWQDNASTFNTLIPLLPSQLSFFCIDLPGHGRSSHYPAGMTYFKQWEGVVIIRRIVTHFNWSNVKLIGHSMGGSLSFLYAAAFPYDVDALICLDVPGPRIYKPSDIISTVGNSIDTFLKYEKLPDEFIPTYNYDEMIDTAFLGYNGSVTREKCKVMMERGMAPAQQKNCYRFTRDVRLKCNDVGRLTEEQILEFASRIRCKVLNIRAVPGLGSKDLENYMKILDKLRMNSKSLEYYEVQGTHHVHLNNPEKLAAHVSNFLLQD